MTALRDQRQISGRRNFKTELATHLPARLVDHLAQDLDLTGNLADWSDARLSTLFDKLQNWSVRPSGSEGTARPRLHLAASQPKKCRQNP
jgi:predicted flavoprotein YhiN